MTELERASAEQNLSSKIRLGVKGGDSCIMTPQPLTFRKLKKTESVPWSCGCQGAAGQAWACYMNYSPNTALSRINPNLFETEKTSELLAHRGLEVSGTEVLDLLQVSLIIIIFFSI